MSVEPLTQHDKDEHMTSRTAAAPATIRAILLNRWLWPALLVGVGALGVGMFVLPAPFPLLALLAVVVLALVAAAYDAQWTPAQGWHNAQAFFAQTDATHNRRNAQAAMCASVLLMALAGIGFRPSPVDDPLTVPLLLAVAGALALGLAVWFLPPLPLFAQPTETALTPLRSAWGVTAVGVLLLGLLGYISAGKTLGDVAVKPVSNHVQFVLLVGGIALVAWGLSGAPPIALADIRARLRLRPLLPLLAIFALALGLRVWNLGDAVRASIDEALIVQGVQHSWGYREAGLVNHVSDLLPISQVFSYWQASLLDLFGRTMDVFRLTNAIVGALAVFAVYLLARELFDRKTGLIAALLLATFPPHLHFSRFAIPHITDALFGPLAIAFLIRGLKHNRRLDWVLGGVSLGLTQYFFESGRLFFPPLLMMMVVVLSLLFWQRIQHHWRGLLMAGLAALFVLAPVYYSLFALDKPRTSRLENSGVSLSLLADVVRGQATPEQVRDVTTRLTMPFQVYVHQPDITRFYAGNQALILEWLVPLFLIGVAYLLWRARTPAVVILLWLFFGAAANVLMRDIANAPRYVIVFPVLALTLAVGLRYGLALLVPWLGGAKFMLAVFALAGMVAFGQANYYFAQHLPIYMQQVREMTAYDGMDALLRAQAIPPTTQLIFVGQPAYDSEVLRIFDGFLSDRINDMMLRSITPDQLTLDSIATLPRDHNYAFFIAPGSETIITDLMQFFELESPQFTPYTDVPQNKAYVLYIANWRPGAG